MKIAYVKSQIRGEIDRLLSTLAEDLLAEGVILSGVVKEQIYTSQHANGCDMKVRVLPTGPVIKITQDLGDGSDACRLDPTALTRAVSQVEALPLDNTNLFVLNKFGPEERVGRGFCGAIAAALERDVPVLVGVGGASEEAFLTFSGGFATELPDDMDILKEWCSEALSGDNEQQKGLR